MSIGPISWLLLLFSFYRIQCECQHPNNQESLMNGFNCTDGTQSVCAAYEICYTTDVFPKGQWELGCRNRTIDETDSTTETVVNNIIHCSAWGEWAAWSGCNKECDSGTMNRTRSAVNQDGETCGTSFTEQVLCNTKTCDSKATVVHKVL